MAVPVFAADDQFLALQPGRIIELAGSTGLGLTRLGLHLLSEPSKRGPVVALDIKGWISPLAAWEVGVDPARLVVVRCPDPSLWPQVVAVLVEGLRAVYAEVPSSVGDHDLRRLAALARARKTAMALRPIERRLPPGVAHLRLEPVEVSWDGAVDGRGRLTSRHLVMEASGKATAGMTRRIEMVDDGANIVCLVSRLGASEGGRAAG